MSHLPVVLPRQQAASDTPENPQGFEEFIGLALEQLCDATLTHHLGDHVPA